MGSFSGLNTQRPHAVCVPCPAQGHISPMLKLAKLLHHKGFFITFVNTEFNHNRLLNSRGLNALNALPDFQFKAIPDGLPPSDPNATQDVPALCNSFKNLLAPLCALISDINRSSSLPHIKIPAVGCIVGDGAMNFSIMVGPQFGIPVAILWTASACGCLGYMQYRNLVQQELVPFKGESFMTNGDLETTIDWTSTMEKIRLRDLPSFIRTTDPDDILLNFFIEELDRLPKCDLIIMNTFDPLEHEVLNVLAEKLPPIYTVGPIHLLVDEVIKDKKLQYQSIHSNLWKEQSGCLEWLDSKEPNSVVYVNFGSVTVMTPQNFIEFALGLANSEKPFLWITRPDLVEGKSAILPPEFQAITKERGFIASWCNQEEILKHPSVGVFLTHSGWNSTLESISGGVPMISWPFFAEQQTNCHYCCTKWGIGMEIDKNVTREEVEKLVREAMEGRKGEEMKNNARDWKRMAEEATKVGGSSYKNFDRAIAAILSTKTMNG